MSLSLETLTPYAAAWLGIFLHDAGRYVIAALAAWALIWVAFARPLAGRKIRADRPAARQLVTEFVVSLRSAFIFSLGGLWIYAMAKAGWLRTEAADFFGWTWAIPCLALMIVAHDAYFYWMHRLLHRPGLFRRAHRRHHRSHNPSPFTAYSFDILEAAALMPFVPLWVLLVPTSWIVVALFMLHQILRNVIGHSGYELMPAGKDGRPLFDWMTTVTHHDLHHAQAGWNYGLYFTWWDRWMGTEHPDYHARFAAALRRPLATEPAESGRGAATLLLAAGLILGILADAQAEPRAAPGDGVHGLWATQGFGAIVALAPCDSAPERSCGRIVWLWQPDDRDGRNRTDAANPDAAAQNRPLVGTMILRDFRESEPGLWTGGAVYNPDDGRSYSGTIRMLPSGALELRGCALGIFCQTQHWRRPADVLQAANLLR